MASAGIREFADLEESVALEAGGEAGFGEHAFKRQASRGFGKGNRKAEAGKIPASAFLRRAEHAEAWQVPNDTLGQTIEQL